PIHFVSLTSPDVYQQRRGLIPGVPEVCRTAQVSPFQQQTFFSQPGVMTSPAGSPSQQSLPLFSFAATPLPSIGLISAQTAAAETGLHLRNLSAKTTGLLTSISPVSFHRFVVKLRSRGKRVACCFRTPILARRAAASDDVAVIRFRSHHTGFRAVGRSPPRTLPAGVACSRGSHQKCTKQIAHYVRLNLESSRFVDFTVLCFTGLWESLRSPIRSNQLHGLAHCLDHFRRVASVIFAAFCPPNIITADQSSLSASAWAYASACCC
ncbi:unnamed protein product, partial [Scytosiphon promiscuus]